MDSGILSTIGHTPLVQLGRIAPDTPTRIWAKLESANPTGSVKDRVALAVIDEAETAGYIGPGAHILEPSSGNTGIALAQICKRRDYHLTVVIPENVTQERIDMLRLYGAEVIFSDAATGSNGAVAYARELVEQSSKWYMPYQYGNAANPRAHEFGTAKELIDQCDHIDAFVAGMGTGGTLMGNARGLRPTFPDIEIIAAEPYPGESSNGLRSLDEGFIPEVIDLALLDRKKLVRNADAVVWTRKLLDQEGLFVGVSAGAICKVAVEVAMERDSGDVVFVVPDHGSRYLSSGIYTKPIDELLNDIDNTFWW
jgi:cysteine synthase B